MTMLMNTQFQTSTRDEFIALGTLLGQHFKRARRVKPWMITLDGDDASGKSLIALAIDQVLTPQRYPRGIPDDVKADDMLNGYFKQNVIFHNFGQTIAVTRETFDGTLHEFEARNPKTKVFVASKIARDFTGDFNYSAGLQSDRLDLNIRVYITREQAYPEDDAFDRKVIMTTENPALQKLLEEAMQSRNLAQAATYHPAAFNL